MNTTSQAKIVQEHPIDAASQLVGGRNPLAKALNVTVAAIGNWKHRGVPIEHCPKIESITKGLITRRALRPSDWQSIWPELAQVPATHQPAAQAAGQGV